MKQIFKENFILIHCFALQVQQFEFYKFVVSRSTRLLKMFLDPYFQFTSNFKFDIIVIVVVDINVKVLSLNDSEEKH